MKKLKLVTLILLSAFIITGCGIKNKEAIVKVNDRIITQGDYDELFKQTANSPALQMFGLDAKQKDKKSFMYTMLKDKVINQLIIRELINGELEKRHIVVTPKDTEEALNKTIENIGSKARFNAILKEHGMSLAEYKKDLVEEVKLNKLIDTLEKVNITEADAKKYYDKNINKFKYPEQVRASHILIAANPEELKELAKAEEKNKDLTEEELKKYVESQMEEKLKKAQDILAQLKKDPSQFAKIAKDQSEDPESAKQGGDLGFFGRDEMVKEFSNAAFSQKPDVIGEIIKTQFGYHIILVTDRKEAGQDSFEKVKNDIIIHLTNEKKVEVLEKFIESLKKTAKIEYLNAEYNPTDMQELLKANDAKPVTGEPAKAEKK
ncbi:peptidylprolyl isomerase [bacterium]|nr:peptidylprolyl isomerase [bacterium]